MEATEGGEAFLAYVALQDARVGLAEIEDDEAVVDVGEFAVEIERDHFAAQFGILLDQDGYAFAVFFGVGDGLGEFVKVAYRVAKSSVVPAANSGSAEWSTRLDQVGNSLPPSRCSKYRTIISRDRPV